MLWNVGDPVIYVLSATKKPPSGAVLKGSSTIRKSAVINIILLSATAVPKPLPANGTYNISNFTHHPLNTTTATCHFDLSRDIPSENKTQIGRRHCEGEGATDSSGIYLGGFNCTGRGTQYYSMQYYYSYGLFLDDLLEEGALVQSTATYGEWDFEKGLYVGVGEFSAACSVQG